MVSCFFQGAGRRQVAGVEVVQRGDVGRAPGWWRAAQSEDAAPGRPRCRARAAGAGRARIICTPVVCWVQPTASRWPRSGRGRRCVECLGDLLEDVARRTADLLDHLRGVAFCSGAADLKDAVRVFHRRVLLRRRPTSLPTWPLNECGLPSPGRRPPSRAGALARWSNATSSGCSAGQLFLRSVPFSDPFQTGEDCRPTLPCP